MKSSTECERARRTLLDHVGADPGDTALSMALDACIDLEDDSALAPAVKHVQSCGECQSWRQTELQPDLFAWRRRVSHYCCGEMFRAVAGPERYVYLQESGPEIRYCWTFGVQGPVIQYCPWCGTQLPPDAFEDGVGRSSTSGIV